MFIKKLNALVSGGGFRLPTEAEWEYACRAGTTSALNSGQELMSVKERCWNLDAVAWYSENSDDTTHPVGQKMPNAWGLYDMHGNVWEFCQDRYGEYPSGAVTDPTGPESWSNRVCRGGNWLWNADANRSAYRYAFVPSCSDYLGFRLARTFKAP